MSFVFAACASPGAQRLPGSEHGSDDRVYRPAAVVILRHAEERVGRHLSAKGRRRAEALIRLFSEDARFRELGPVAGVYASLPKDELGSLRSIETVTPLAVRLGLEVQSPFTAEYEGKLVKQILSRPETENRVIVIAWPHHGIDRLARKLGVPGHVPEWKSSVFDRAWILRFPADESAKPTYEDVPQRLLPGDARD